MKRTRWIPLGIAVVVLLLLACNAQNEVVDHKNSEETTALPIQSTEPAAADLVIPLQALSEEPTFWSYTADGTPMELIAIRDADGVRLALNTCQSCGGSPYAWFEYLGDGVLQCQNCGLTFPTATVGTPAANGCNPVTVSTFAVDGTEVTVPAALLRAESARFANWKVFDE